MFLTPLWFGAAHLHRLYEGYLDCGRVTPGMVAAGVVQFGYTTVFGWWASWVLVRTGGVAAVVLGHGVANWVGLPGGGGGGWRGVGYWVGCAVGAAGFWGGRWWATEGGGLVDFEGR